MKIINEIEFGQRICFTVKGDEVLVISARLCVPADEELKNEILDETHKYAYVMHHGNTKIYHTLCNHY